MLRTRAIKSEKNEPEKYFSFFLGDTQPVIERFNKFVRNVIILWFRAIFPQPVIEHDTDHYTADKGLDKAVFIILSLLTDKQAYFSETHEQSPWD